MTLEEQINKQRVKHIISSYQLDGEESEACTKYVEELLQIFPSGLIELALAETIVRNWVSVPMPKGVVFFDQVRELLTHWQTEWQTNTISERASFGIAKRASYPMASTLSSEEFQYVTGLDPSPIFGSPGFQQPPSVVRP